MTDSCQGDQRLCPIYKGDGVPFTFEFKNADETAKDVSGLKLYFTMKLDPESPDGKRGDLQYSIIFPEGGDSIEGKGTMLVPVDKTSLLAAKVDYFYDFKIIEGGVPYTLGSGLVYVKQGTTKASS